MKTIKAIKLAGSQAELGRVFDPPLTRQSIQQWGENVPPLRVYHLKELRPDWFLKPKGKR